ncbi:hypothetical protein E3G71_001045 [Mycobacteroides abscessus]|nr:hypothetical protein [Mycobacteroides abscessus]MBE5518140.1 hypothetical protein [Mycobacteroides abscessus]
MALTSVFSDCATVLERCKLVNMSNRPRRSTKSESVTSPARVSLLTCGFTLGLLALVPPNTAYAWDCPGVTEAQIEICEREGQQTPAHTHSSGSSFFDDWGGLLFAAGIIAFIAWVVIANRRESAEKKAEKRAGELARGRAIAEQHHARAVQRAHEEAAAQVPPREVYDPMNMGAVPPPVEPVIPAPPSTDPVDLQRYTVFGAVTPWEAGTAFAAVVPRDGSLSRATAAWLTAAQEAGLGETDEAGTFTPSAVLTNVRYIDGDVELVVQPAGLHIAEKALDRALPFLVVEARVERATPFVREAATGRYVTTLTNVAREQSAPAPEAAPANDPTQWEW